MVKVEFWCEPSGEVRYKLDNEPVQRLTRFSKDVIDEVLKLVQNRFPKAYERLCEIHSSGVGDMEKRFRMANHFIRCNFGAHDLLTADMFKGHLNIEEVSCPLRGDCGLCRNEGVICKPKDILALSPRQNEILAGLVDGKSCQEIADSLGVALSTVKNTLRNICRKLGVKSVTALLAYIIQHNIVI